MNAPIQNRLKSPYKFLNENMEARLLAKQIHNHNPTTTINKQTDSEIDTPNSALISSQS